MAGQHNKITIVLAQGVPARSAGSSSKRVVKKPSQVVKKSSQVETRSAHTIYKDKYSNCSSHVTQQHKKEVFVDKHSGRPGYKKEVKVTSTHKVNDKIHGNTIEHQTQVKYKKTVYPNKTTPKCNNIKSITYY